MSSVSTVLIELDRLRIFYETGSGRDSNTNQKNYVPTIAGMQSHFMAIIRSMRLEMSVSLASLPPESSAVI